MPVSVFENLARTAGLKETELGILDLSFSVAPDEKRVMVEFKPGPCVSVSLMEHEFGGLVTFPRGKGTDRAAAVEDLLAQARGKVLRVMWQDDEQVKIPVPKDFVPPKEGVR